MFTKGSGEAQPDAPCATHDICHCMFERTNRGFLRLRLDYDPFAYRRAGAAQGIPGSCSEILETQNWLGKTKQGLHGSQSHPHHLGTLEEKRDLIALGASDSWATVVPAI
jgi:hypothetical protein